LGDDMTVIDRLVLRESALRGLDLFLVAEDTDNMIVSERVQRHLASFDFPDVAFEEIETV
ncbi:MAG TPA: hypothetical protein VMF89_15345, partial [Polyangiales bacterium]|nr:hypothetical protein [Polyangiales bacterium]